MYVFRDAHGSDLVVNRDLMPVGLVDRSPRIGVGTTEPFSFYPAPRLLWPLALGARGASNGSWRSTRIASTSLQARGRVIVTASRAGEVSFELPELGHGLFTHYLVRGLGRIVTVQEVYEYVHPTMKGELDGPLPLVRVGP